MSLKERLENDLMVFFDAEKLADEVIINSKKYTCFFTEDKHSGNNKFGAFVESKNLLLKEPDYTEIGPLKVNDELRANGKTYIVKNVSILKGTVKIRLEGNRSWRLQPE